MDRTLEELLIGKKSHQSIANTIVESVQVNGTDRRSEHYAFFQDKVEPAELPAKAVKALKLAKLKAKPIKVFSELSGFSAQLNETEAVQLREVPSIQSVELDQPLPLTPPVEIKPVSSSASSTWSSKVSALYVQVSLMKPDQVMVFASTSNAPVEYSVALMLLLAKHAST